MELVKGVSLRWLFLLVLQFLPLLYGVKAFVWLGRMMHHMEDPSNAMIGGDNSQTRSPWGEQVKEPDCSTSSWARKVSTSYFLLQLSDSMMETCMLLAGVRAHEHW